MSRALGAAHGGRSRRYARAPPPVPITYPPWRL